MHDILLCTDENAHFCKLAKSKLLSQNKRNILDQN